MSKTKLHYCISDGYDTKGRRKIWYDTEGYGYAWFSAYDDNENEVSFCTNAQGYGLFEYDHNQNIYRQLTGTGQWQLPLSASTCRKMLREQWENKYEWQHAEE